MPFFNRIVFVFLLAAFSQKAWTENRQCVVNPGNRNEIATSFHQSQEPEILRFRQIANGQQNSEAGSRGTGPYIKEACLISSLKRVAGSEGYTCASGENVSGNNRARRISATRQCITQDMVSYIQVSVQNAMKCVSDASGVPVDGATLYQKINNESAFQFFQSNRGGTGMGQLTSWPIRDMFQARRGLYSAVLEKIQNSAESACESFKSIVENDRKPNGATLYPRNKICKYVSPGEGMNRNLLYSLVYMSNLKDQVLRLLPQGFLASGQRDLGERIRLIERLALVGYGPEGMAKARGMARSIRSNTNMQAAHQRVTRGSYYLRATDSKSRQALAAAQPPLTEASGCIVEPDPSQQQSRPPVEPRVEPPVEQPPAGNGVAQTPPAQPSSFSIESVAGPGDGSNRPPRPSLIESLSGPRRPQPGGAQ